MIFEQKKVVSFSKSVLSKFKAVFGAKPQGDPWEPLIADFLDRDENKAREHFTAADILIGACKKDPQSIMRADQHRLLPLMKDLGWVSTRKRMDVDGEIKQSRVYVRPVSGLADAVGVEGDCTKHWELSDWFRGCR